MGIDVYNGTGPVAWERVKAAGHWFAFVKATEALSLVDKRFAANLAGLKAAGMRRGAYHFYHCALTPEKQAQHVVQASHDAGYDFKADLPLVLDLEDRAGVAVVGPTSMRHGVSAFLQTVEKLTGKRPIIYLDYDFGQHILGSGFGQYPLWIASYTHGPKPNVPVGWKDWAFWQYSEDGSIPGIEGAVVDLDRFNGPDIMTWGC